MPALRAIYRARDAEAGLKALEVFEEGYWGQKYPAIAQSWRRNWEHVVPFFAFPEGVRRIIYTTNAIEALNSKLRRAVRSRGHFPGDEAAMKLLYLVLNNAAEQWKRAPREWVGGKDTVRRHLWRAVLQLMKPAHRTEFLTVPADLHAAVKQAIQLGAIGFDAVKHLILCRVERRPPRLDLSIYPYLPRATVEKTSAKAYMRLLSSDAGEAA